MSRKILLGALLALIVVLPAAIYAETVHLKDGRKFTGTVSEKGGAIDLDTGYGILHIARADILRIEGKTSVAPKPPKQETAKPKTPVIAPETAEEIKKALLESITNTELSDHVKFLASEELEGRGTGDKGGKLARDYIVREFKSYGLKPGGDTQTYTQKFSTQFGDSWNVVGYIEGSDPKLKSEIVVIGAHYDHLGRGKYGSAAGPAGRGKIHPGADDNASGTAGVLEIAEAFTEKGIKPKRTVVFICFGAEEIGLVGSRYYCENPTFPLEKTITMLNMDMIARNELEKLYVFGLANSKQLEKIVEEANSDGLTVTKSQMTPNSDHYSFYAKGVPAIFFNSGMHRDLHKPTDTHDKCDFNKAEKIAELVALTTVGVIEYESKIEMEKAQGRNPWGRRRRGPRLGITPSPAEFTKEDRQKYGLGENDAGIGVHRIHPGTIADKGGLKEGDIIIKLDGERIPSDDMWQWLRRALTKAQEKKKITYTVIRDGKKVTGTLSFQDK
jgi:hypothetical protein